MRLSLTLTLALVVGTTSFRSAVLRPLRPARAGSSRAAVPYAQLEAAELPQVGVPEAPPTTISRANAVYKFSRPHTIRGTLLACFTGVARALVESPMYLGLLPALMPRAAMGVMALLLGNLFIVGINQIYDVEIDQVNKPFLPIAAGQLSPNAAWAIVLGSAAAGLAIVKACFSPLIFGLYLFGTTIGGLYSVPPFQLKRFPLAAGLTIATCRGFLLNFGVYYATREALGLAFTWSPPVGFLARFMTVYAAVIAVTKDLPDIEGDKKGGIETFAMRVGPRKAAAAASAVLALNYVGAVATALLAAPGAFRRPVMVVGHLLGLAWLWKSHRALDTSDMGEAAIKGYYGQIWNLFYYEYMMYPFI